MNVAELDTPSLLFDLDVVERNIAGMAEVARNRRGAATSAHEDAQVP